MEEKLSQECRLEISLKSDSRLRELGAPHQAQVKNIVAVPEQ